MPASRYARAANLSRRTPLGRVAGVLALVALTMVVLAGCTTQAQPAGSEDQADGPGTAIDFPITLYQGQQALGGQEIQFSDLLAEGKPVVLNFWAGQCPPCKEEMPDLNAAYQAHRDQVLFFGLDVGPFMGLGSRESGKALLNELGVSYPVGTTLDAQVVRDYQVLYMPTTVFIKPDGEIARTWSGLLTREKIDELVSELVAS